MKLKINNLKSIFSIVPISLLIVSCNSDANLAKVRQFSENADQVAQKLPVITDDFYVSCLRKAYYEPIRFESNNTKANSDLNTKNKQALLKISLLNKQLVTQGFGLQNKQKLKELEQKLESNLLADSQKDSGDYQSKRLNTAKECGLTENQKTSKKHLSSLMNKGNSVIVLYMKKLGTLASEDLINFDSEFNSLATNLTSFKSDFSVIPQLSDQQISSGSIIASLIVNQSFENERVDTINDVVTIANQPLKNYVAGLQNVIKRVYLGQYLENEETSLDTYYTYYIDKILDNDNNQSVANIAQVLVNIDRDWNLAKLKIQERKDFANSYIDLLQNVVDGHQQLATIYNDGKQPSGKEIQQVIDTNNKAVKDFVNKAKALNKSEQ